jgi:dihydroorotate dehydrogenase (fumarate)
MNLTTNYLGLKLRTPLVPSASPLCESLDQLKRMEDAGASAVVLHSLFEENIRAGSTSVESYVEHLARAKQSLEIPVIASLNGTSFGSWTTLSRQLAQAGADALELNLYSIPTDNTLAAEEIESSYLTILASVKAQVKIPVAVKLSPYFTNLGHFARQLDQLGADALVLFNRFYQPDIDLETREVTPNLMLSSREALRLPMRWIAILHGRVRASLAATGGIHTGSDALKLLMAGADVTMLCATLFKNGIEHIFEIEREIREWLEAHGHDSIAQIQGCLSQQNCPDPAAFERAQYIQAIRSFASAHI